ncbi:MULTISPECIES: SDR family NAD(P)-dependent oxidoreductase [unclassified Spirosoma]|uniref:SDR family NAD(P)-dependent oxidoreductase n=1 Tax=unclassified Spirosoma TaxID=2621999 RepID=UPI00095D66DC|nr:MULTISPECIES: SDR family NAD(P)-dependent oxidoreductase [unclassified Spirosoma]MBN8826646.1 SDR family oxidoreductase [Spirosoma sp.]OJW74483.1 MAG: 3-oxoacyl-ACP reductase [Spirosoma sp. 48-14]
MGEFSGQVALVTGAASGIGLSIVHKLLAEGAQVGLLDFNESALQQAFEKYGPDALRIGIDITDEGRVNEAVSQVHAHFGKIDALINCVGITGITNVQSHEVSSENLHKVFEVNFMSSFYTCKATLPFMLDRSYGRILHIASIAGKEGNAGMLAYSASKAAVICMAKVQGKEYAEKGITVNALAPAVIQTPLVDAMPEVQVKYMTDKIPMKRCGTLDEAANLAAYIVSPKNSFTTGFTFDLSGGRATY